MFENGSPIVRPPHALQFNSHVVAELNRIVQSYLPPEQPLTAVQPETAKPVTEAPRASSAEFNRVLWSAESMIASVLGLKTSEVSICVNAGRYVL